VSRSSVFALKTNFKNLEISTGTCHCQFSMHNLLYCTAYVWMLLSLAYIRWVFSYPVRSCTPTLLHDNIWINY
jgi:hypothetical protein